MDLLVWKKYKIDYENEDDQHWIKYLHENLDRPISFGSSFPGSSWNYQRHDSAFDREDGLKRSDVDLHADVMQALYESQEVDASLIEVIVLSGHVLLTGKVQSLKAKTKAEEVVSKLSGVWMIKNELIIEQPS